MPDALEPKDAFNLVYVTYWLVGVSLLLPFTAMLTAVDFNDRDAKHPIELLLAVVYLYADFFFILTFAGISVVWGLDWVPSAMRVTVSLASYAVGLLLLPLVPTTPVACLAAGMFGFGDALLQSTVYPEVGAFAPRYTQALQSGTAAAGVAAAALRIATKALFADTRVGLLRSTILYYATAAGVIGVTQSLYWLVVCQSPFYAHFRSKRGDVAVPVAAAGASSKRSYASARRALKPRAVASLGSTAASLAQPLLGVGDTQSLFAYNLQAARAPKWRTTLAVCWPQCLGVLVTFTLTCSISPAVTTAVHPCSGSFTQLSFGWFQVILIAWGAVWSLAGKVLPAFWMPALLAETRWGVLVAALGRLPIVAGVLLIAGTTKVFCNDAFSFGILALFAFTDGVVGTSGMMLAPLTVRTPAQQAQAGLISSLFLITGLTLGISLSWLVPVAAVHAGIVH